MSTNIHQTAGCVCSAALLAALAACGGGETGAVAPVTPATYTVGGTATGPWGPGLVLENSSGNGRFDDLAVSNSGSFTFGVPLSKGLEYAIGVKTQPLTPPQYGLVGEPSGSGMQLPGLSHDPLKRKTEETWPFSLPECLDVG